jgi:fumarylpyruvate hydrolase
MIFVIPEPSRATIPVQGSHELFPVRRIFCVGRNYAEHAREMGGDPNREPPFFFTKPADALVPMGGKLSFPIATRMCRRIWVSACDLPGSQFFEPMPRA